MGAAEARGAVGLKMQARSCHPVSRVWLQMQACVRTHSSPHACLHAHFGNSRCAACRKSTAWPCLVVRSELGTSVAVADLLILKSWKGVTECGGVAQDKTLMLDNPVAAKPKSAEAAAAQRRRRLRERPASARTLRALGLAKLPEAERRQAHGRLHVLPCFANMLPFCLEGGGARNWHDLAHAPSLHCKASGCKC